MTRDEAECDGSHFPVSGSPMVGSHTTGENDINAVFVHFQASGPANSNDLNPAP